DGETRPFGEGGRAWLASILLGIDRQSGFAAQARVPELMKRGGATAVLDEIGHMTGDYARGRYYAALFGVGGLDSATVQRVLEQLPRQITSDYEMGRVLSTISNRYDLGDDNSRIAFLRATDRIKSEYEHGRVLTF